MRQLTQWAPAYKDFEKAKTEVICVFREEKLGNEGLEKSRQTSKAKFPFADDPGAKQTAGFKSYYAYLIDKQGVVRAIAPGTKRTRAQADAILKEIEKLE